MSGIFKNFERLLSASNFATKNHRFLIKYPFGKINPASYYWDPVARREGL
jgi:hypothetical protein